MKWTAVATLLILSAGCASPRSAAAPGKQAVVKAALVGSAEAITVWTLDRYGRKDVRVDHLVAGQTAEWVVDVPTQWLVFWIEPTEEKDPTPMIDRRAYLGTDSRMEPYILEVGMVEDGTVFAIDFDERVWGTTIRRP